MSDYKEVYAPDMDTACTRIAPDMHSTCTEIMHVCTILGAARVGLCRAAAAHPLSTSLVVTTQTSNCTTYM